MAVVRLPPTSACPICGSTSNNPPHADSSECLNALDNEMRDLLRRVGKLTDERAKIISAQLAEARRRASSLARRLSRDKPA